MRNNETNVSPSRTQAVPLLAQKFVRDYDTAIKGYDLANKLKLTDHLIEALGLMEKYGETNDQRIWEKYRLNEESLSKKYGKELKPYSDRQFYKYFFFDTVLTEKDIYNSDQFNGLAPAEQSLTLQEQQVFIRLCRNFLLNARSFLYLQADPENTEAITAISDAMEPDREFTKARQLLAIYYLLKAGFNIEHRSTHTVSSVARFAHLLTGTKLTNLQNSDIYKKYSLMPDYKSGEQLIEDLKFIRPYFEELNIAKAVELIDESIIQIVKKRHR